MNFLKRYLVLSIILAGTIGAKAQCPATLNDLLAGGTFHNGLGGPITCNYAAGGAIATLGNINFTGSLTLTGVTTFTIANDVVWNGGLFNIQGAGDLVIGNGTSGSLTIASGTVRTNDLNSGTITLAANSLVVVNPGATLQSYSTISISANSTLSNSGTVTNATGGISINGSLSTGSGSTVTTAGTITVSSTGSLTMDPGSSVSTNGNITINGEFQSEGALTATGTGIFTVGSTADFNLDTNGSIQAVSMSINASGTATNNGVMTASGFAGITLAGNFTNSGTINLTSTTGDITINGTVTNNNQITALDDIIVTGTGNFTISGTGSMSAEDFAVNANGVMTIQAGGQVATTGTDDNTIQGSITTFGDLTLGGDLVVTGATANVTMQVGSSITIVRFGGEGDLEVTNGGTFTMNGGTLAVQDDITTWVNGSDSQSFGYITLNGIVNLGDDIIITGGTFENDGTITGVDDIDISAGNFYNDGAMTVDDIFVTGTGTLRSNVAGATITLADEYADVNCPYANGVYHYCSCIGNPADGDGESVICASALPIELVAFSGHQNGTAIQLNWTTATETNNEFFTIEKLTSTDVFKEVVRIPGAGTTLIKQDYSATDPNPSIGKNYYRLKQTDYDRKTSHSELIKVVFESNTFVVQVYPNPVTDKNVTIFVQGMRDNESITLELKNTLGQTLLSTQALANASGSAEVELSLPNMPVGVYIINVNGNSQKILVR